MLLRAEPCQRSAIPAPGTPAWQAFVEEVVVEGFAMLRRTNVATRWKALHGGVGLASIPSLEPAGAPLRAAHWHARSSFHFVQDGVTFEQFSDGLLRDHTENEAQYIHALEKAERLEELVPGVASIWHLCYRTPRGSAPRDFVELVFTLPLPPTEQPFSNQHEIEVLAAHRQGALRDAPPAAADDRRAFMVVSLPVEHERTAGYVRAYYASVEGVREDELQARLAEPCVHWLMATQSDAQGWIPRWVQELAMPSQIKADVPAFFKWLQTKQS